MSRKSHKKNTPDSLNVKIISFDREESLKSVRDLIIKNFEEWGHEIKNVDLFDKKDNFEERIKKVIDFEKDDLIITIGRTGITSKDIIPEVINEISEKNMPGFGEYLRLKAEKINKKHIFFNRSTAGIYKKTPIFCFPSEERLVKICLDLLKSEVGHIVKHSQE